MFDSLVVVFVVIDQVAIFHNILHRSLLQSHVVQLERYFSDHGGIDLHVLLQHACASAISRLLVCDTAAYDDLIVVDSTALIVLTIYCSAAIFFAFKNLIQ